MATLLEQLAILSPDPFRTSTPFATDVADASTSIFRADNDSDREKILNSWLSRYQPCLFGRHAAKVGLIAYCILTRADVERGDAHVRDKIQASRLAWKRMALRGEKSGFVVLLADEALANAKPGTEMAALAQRLCQLYLNQEIPLDSICLEYLDLEIPGVPPSRWRWRAGVNVFASGGDGRWWQDHRIPGGLAFSVNSVGHMARAGQLKRGMQALASIVEGDVDAGVGAGSIDTREKALTLAMKTIRSAADAVSGKATWLMPADAVADKRCPFILPPDLVAQTPCNYGAFYNTDQTVPSIYFRPDQVRPDDADELKLDFTYLFLRSPDNPDFETMGGGERVQANEKEFEPLPEKLSRWVPTRLDPEEDPQVG